MSAASVATQRVPEVKARSVVANLDCLRSFAVLSVLVSHGMVMTTSILTGKPIYYPWGAVGVMAFFVHTSLVLMLSLERMHRSSPDALARRFYIRRLFRLYPLSILCVAVTMLFQLPAGYVLGTEYRPFTPGAVVANLLLVQNFFTHRTIAGPMWSLPYEVDMYLVLPFLFYVAIRKDSWKIFIWAILAFSVLGFVVRLMLGHTNILGYVPCFLAGVFAFSVRKLLVPRIPAAVWPIFLLVWFTIFGSLLKDRPMTEQFLVQWSLCFLLGVSIYLFHESQNRVWNRVTAIIAKYSYGIYLSHMPAIWLVVRTFKITEPVTMMAMWLFITAIGSVLAYHLLEGPMINVGRKFSDR
ncbi:MAG TPA: acyltransferase [Armatimonadota bacterium]